MAEKWTAAEDLTTQGAEFQKGTTGRVLHSNDMAAVLNALEADKAALLEALEELLGEVWSPLVGMCDICGQQGFHDPDCVAIKAQALLSRIRSEGAEVKAGE